MSIFLIILYGRGGVMDRVGSAGRRASRRVEEEEEAEVGKRR